MSEDISPIPGIELAPLTSQNREKYQIPTSVRGVLVTGQRVNLKLQKVWYLWKLMVHKFWTRMMYLRIYIQESIVFMSVSGNTGSLLTVYPE